MFTMAPDNALPCGVRDQSVVRVRIAGDRELFFGDVLVHGRNRVWTNG
ncbi:MAG: hypothetical protein ACJ8FY_02120 [Gemmataceae bacterium]